MIVSDGGQSEFDLSIIFLGGVGMYGGGVLDIRPAFSQLRKINVIESELKSIDELESQLQKINIIESELNRK